MTTDAVGGVFTYTLDLVRALTAQAVEFVVATMGPPLSADQRRRLSAVPSVRLLESTFALEWMDDPWSDVDRAGEWLLSLEERFQPDVVHLNGFSHGSLAWRAPVLLVAHSSVLSWWRAVHGEAAPARYEHYRARVRAGLERADRVIAPTRAMAASLAREDGFSGGVRIVPNGADEREFRPARAKGCFLLAAGRIWDEAKNLSVILRAAPELPWPVRIAGAGRGRGQISSVELLGERSRSELASLMERAPIFLHPARYEPFGLAPLEAALSGAALVLGDIESLREVWGDAALYAAPDDVSVLVTTVRRLIADPWLVREFGARARARARSYSLERTSELYLQIYRELVASRGALPAVRSPASCRAATLRVERAP